MIELDPREWRPRQEIHEELAGTAPFELAVVGLRQHHDGVSTVNRDVLGAFTLRPPHKFREPRLGVLERPGLGVGTGSLLGRGGAHGSYDSGQSNQNIAGQRA